MQKERLMTQVLDCKCKFECNGSPTKQPIWLHNPHTNEIEKHCLEQKLDNATDVRKCRFLYWRDVEIIKEK